jgi:hypothetical protein
LEIGAMIPAPPPPQMSLLNLPFLHSVINRRLPALLFSTPARQRPSRQVTPLSILTMLHQRLRAASSVTSPRLSPQAKQRTTLPGLRHKIRTAYSVLLSLNPRPAQANCNLVPRLSPPLTLSRNLPLHPRSTIYLPIPSLSATTCEK